MTGDKPWYKDPRVIVPLVVAILSIPFVSQIVSERLPGTTTSNTVSITTGSTVMSQSLLIKVNPHAGWYTTPDGQAFAIIPRDQTTTFDFILINVSNSTLEVLGANVQIVYPNGTDWGYFRLVENATFQLTPGESRTITFDYDLGLPRVPGWLGGKLILTIVGQSENAQWKKVEPVLVVYQ